MVGSILVEVELVVSSTSAVGNSLEVVVGTSLDVVVGISVEVMVGRLMPVGVETVVALSSDSIKLTEKTIFICKSTYNDPNKLAHNFNTK